MKCKKWGKSVVVKIISSAASAKIPLGFGRHLAPSFIVRGSYKISLCQLPGISPKMAGRLIQQFGRQRVSARATDDLFYLCGVFCPIE
jgi:hypothetical protein